MAGRLDCFPDVPENLKDHEAQEQEVEAEADPATMMKAIWGCPVKEMAKPPWTQALHSRVPLYVSKYVGNFQRIKY